MSTRISCLKDYSGICCLLGQPIRCPLEQPRKSGPAQSWTPPWKSVASAPLQVTNKFRAFSPSISRSLKALDPRRAYAALKGPLFHEFARVENIVANDIPICIFLVCVLVTIAAHAQVTFERLVNSTK